MISGEPSNGETEQGMESDGARLLGRRSRDLAKMQVEMRV